ncbi:diguanylate cyclase domain-containing protein [Roseibium sp.]|uniref:diguanylate cyclase domain-containing protein n=1 Tax=Roseibium sp. TaxID=1936156 RepID=UPI003BAA258C
MTTRQAQPDRGSIPGSGSGTVSGRQITMWVYGLAALLIILSSGALTLIAQFAWRAADRHALETAQMRFLDTVEDQYWEIARHQMTAIQHQDVQEMLTGPMDRSAVTTSILNRFKAVSDLERTYLLEENSDLMALSETVGHNPGVSSAPWEDTEKLSELFTAAFRSPSFPRRDRPQGPFPPPRAMFDASIAALAVIDGTPALLSAVPVEMETPLTTLSDANPRLLVSVYSLGEAWFQSMSDHYGFRDLTFTEGAPAREHPTQLRAYGPDGSLVGYFQWDHSKPGLRVWMRALPLIVILAVLIAAISVIVARRIGRLSSTLEQSERRNHYFAHHDSLTGLPNRHHFSDRLAYAIDGLPENGFAVIACDLDKFKPVNDTHGHEAGDIVLRVTASRLQDIISDKGVVGRIGGDEFVILLMKYQDQAELETIANEILASVAEPIEISPEQSVSIGISLGIALAPDSGMSEKHLIRAADTTLYRAKDAGRNAYAFAHAEPDTVFDRRGETDRRAKSAG